MQVRFSVGVLGVVIIGLSLASGCSDGAGVYRPPPLAGGQTGGGSAVGGQSGGTGGSLPAGGTDGAVVVPDTGMPMTGDAGASDGVGGTAGASGGDAAAGGTAGASGGDAAAGGTAGASGMGGTGGTAGAGGRDAAVAAGPLDAARDSAAPDSGPADAAQPASPDTAPPPPDMAPPDLYAPPPDTAPDQNSAEPPPQDAAPPPDVAPDAPWPQPAVVITEIMYHPVLEDSLVENHEFVEIYNRAPGPVSLAGWRMAGEISYTFPAGTVIPAGAYRVVARNRSALAAVWNLNPADLYGNYDGELDNGGGLVTLVDATGNVIDGVRYDDEFPWPIGADALGAGEVWLPDSNKPLSAHRYKGRSLERHSFSASAALVANWSPSPLDGATPGRPNSVGGSPRAIVETLTVARASGAGGLVRAGDQVRVRAGFSSLGSVSDVRLESFVDDVAATGEPTTLAAMARVGGAWEVTLPPGPDNSIVRYRIRGNRGNGDEVISPRPSDPYGWHAYFVSPQVNAPAPPYQLFIAPADWTQLWDNVNFSTEKRRVNGCEVRASWDARVPAVFVYEGVVHDVRVRYQGSRWNRTNGLTIDDWTAPGPARPSPLRALSWNIDFPRYRDFERRRTLVLSKLNQSCPGLNAALGERLYRDAGVPASRVKFARLHINGAYYHYMMDYEHPGEPMMARYRPQGQPMGDLFKASGCACDEGPWGWGDSRQLAAFCGYSSAQRYEATYERKTNDWKNHGDFITMLEGLHAARAAGNAALRSFLAQTFDLDATLSYLAVRNWSLPWDDMFHNHYLHRRGDGKWLMMPWDLDLEMGQWGSLDATASFYIGQQGDPSNRSGMWNYLKDSFLRSGVYRAEFNQRLRTLSQGVLSPANVKAMADESMALFDADEAEAAPGGLKCDPELVLQRIKNFADARHAELGKSGRLTN